jgi:hypothetical protein
MKLILRYLIFFAIGVSPALVGYSILDSWQAWAYILIMNTLVFFRDYAILS